MRDAVLLSAKRSTLFILAVFILFMGLGTATASAAPVIEASGPSALMPMERSKIDPVINIGKNDSTVSYLVNKSNEIAGFPMLTYTSGDGLLSFNSSGYSDLEMTDKQDVMKATLDGIKTSDLSPQRKNSMYNFVAEQDGAVTKAIRILSTDAQADLSRAGSMVKVFSTPLGVFMGLLVLLTFILLTLSTAIDLFFITLPPFRAFVMKDENSRPFYVSTEAFHAMKVSDESVGTGTYKGAVGLYSKNRFWVFLVVPILLVMLVTGQIWDFLLAYVPVLNW